MANGKAQKSQGAAVTLARSAPLKTGRFGKAEKSAVRLTAPTMQEALTAVFIKEDEGGYCGYVEEIPGAITQGETLEEAKENLVEAVQLVVQANRHLSGKRIAAEKYDVIKKPLGRIAI
ncbi:MAG: type II toxin-antitoxin system HicB family antitoxin [Gammaproteobacteria bacterium]|nr:type II toxin-antitoxin system HicB family antitoxin [Gammaproteobacteria bacterium]MDD9800768.1 type II toxin-antitoxin system HicB family antitoxin [Gammaproteobacteria bacterium]